MREGTTLNNDEHQILFICTILVPLTSQHHHLLVSRNSFRQPCCAEEMTVVHGRSRTGNESRTGKKVATVKVDGKIFEKEIFMIVIKVTN